MCKKCVLIMGLIIVGIYFLYEGGYVTRLINPAEYWEMQASKAERHIQMDQELIRDISVEIAKRELTFDLDVQSRRQNVYGSETPELAEAKARADVQQEIQQLHDSLKHWSQQLQSDRQRLAEAHANVAEHAE